LPGLSLALVGSFFLRRTPGWLVASVAGAETEVGAVEGASCEVSALSAEADIGQTIFID